MRALAAALVASLLLGGCAAGPGGPGTREYYERRILRANPSKVIATEIAFARAAQEKGQWTAFAEFAADDAVMFVPEPVNAKNWLRQQVNPPRAVAWQPHQVWSSCDGTLAVTKGAWQRPDGSVGYFTTVWERQRDGEYKWVMDQGDSLEQPLEAPDFIDAKAADCIGPNAAIRDRMMPDLPRSQVGRSRDGALSYVLEVEADLGRRFTVSMMQDGILVEVLDLSVAAPKD